MALTLMEGNEAVAWGAIASNCRFFAGYPITPATTIFNTMLKLLPSRGGTCLQGEDEIASIGYCLGASMAGLKVMTATSGPGISLYSEHISFAIGSEIPIVIVDVQRLGPSTGSATRGADGDIQFLRWGSSGGLPLIILSPMDVRDCFVLTMEAFNLAEVFRCPVIIASNKEIGMTKESIDLEKLKKPKVENRQPPLPGESFFPFKISEDRSIPGFLPIGGEVLVRQTSSTHGPDGYITTDNQEISNNLNRLNDKLVSSEERLTFYESQIAEDAKTLILTYGVTARAAKMAVENQKQKGKSVALLVLKTLWPVPEDLIRRQARSVERVVVLEMNLGQYVREIQRILPNKHVEFFGQMNGTLITPHQIEETIIHG
jgi:2-oxoglutarate ferredoxin oxidoreductase subunit alpha